MFKIVKSKTLRDYDELVLALSNNNTKLSDMNDELHSKLFESDKRIVDLLEEINKLKRLTAESKTENSVTLVMDDNLQKITPLIRYKSNVFDTLFQNGYLNDTQNSNVAIELALITVAADGLNQLIDSFAPNISE